MSAECRNCGAALTGRYCSHCGQAAAVHVPSVKEIVHEVLEGLTHSDSRLWKSLTCLWLKPGQLTLEFIAGRRAAYLPPFRLYLILSVLFFFLSSLTHHQLVVLQVKDDHSVQFNPKDFRCEDINGMSVFGRPDWNARLVHACNAASSDNGAGLEHLMAGLIPKVLFVFLPLIALLNMCMYWRPRRRYAEHLLFFLHTHAFYFSIGIVSLLAEFAANAWPALDPAREIVDLTLFLALIFYTVMAMRRVFRRSWPNTLSKALALALMYLITMALGMAALSIYAILQL